MDLPASVTALGEQLCRAGEIMPDPALFREAEVFAAERERIFARPWIAVDHETRLSEDARYFRCDAAPRSLIVARDSEGQLHALRNVCIHAGYPVCDVEEGSAERLICPYHGWEYALDGRLVEPMFSSRIDPSRLRLKSYRACTRNGLILVDPSGETETAEEIAGAVPAWVADARVVRRAQYSTALNWKYVNQFLRTSPHLFFDDPPESSIEFGPLSVMLIGSRRAALLRVIPKFAEQTDIHLVEIVAADAPADTRETTTADAGPEALRLADTSHCRFDRRFGDWYWSLMSEER